LHGHDKASRSGSLPSFHHLGSDQFKHTSFATIQARRLFPGAAGWSPIEHTGSSADNTE